MKSVPISVVIPLYNGERFIRDAIESVQLQTLGVDEIIVVDNNSTDNSRKIAEEMRVKVIHQPKQGTPAARNLGIKESRNDWIALLDQDDLWKKDKIEYQWKAIEMFPTARFIGCELKVFYEHTGQTSISSKGKKPPEDSDIELREIPGAEVSFVNRIQSDMFNWFYSQTSCTILHREMVSAVGGFNESIEFCDEVEFFLRFLRPSPVAKVMKELVIYRRHNQNHSLQEERLYPNFLKITEMMLSEPDKYPKGAGEFYREMVIDYFVQNGLALAGKLKAREADSNQ